jgi:hypothetical protein
MIGSVVWEGTMDEVSRERIATAIAHCLDS